MVNLPEIREKVYPVIAGGISGAAALIGDKSGIIDLAVGHGGGFANKHLDNVFPDLGFATGIYAGLRPSGSSFYATLVGYGVSLVRPFAHLMATRGYDLGNFGEDALRTAALVGGGILVGSAIRWGVDRNRRTVFSIASRTEDADVARAGIEHLEEVGAKVGDLKTRLGALKGTAPKAVARLEGIVNKFLE